MRNRKASGDAETDTNAIKDPDDWITGDEPMTGAQKSYLTTLAEQAQVEPPAEELTKAEASKIIDDLRDKLGLQDVKR